MPILLLLVYHLLLLGGLALASGMLSGIEIVLVLALILLGGSALFETELLIEPGWRRRGAPAPAAR